MKIETQWADIVRLVSELILQTYRGCTTSVVPRGVPVRCTRYTCAKSAGPSDGGMGGVAVHAKHAIRSCGGTTGSPRGTILVVQPLEVCNIVLILKHKAHDISPLCIDLQTYFIWKW